MAKWTVGKECENYIMSLRALQMATDTVLGRAIYVGAKIVADEVAKNIDALPVDNDGGLNRRRNGVTTSQKAGLKAGLGIAKLQNNNGFVNVKIGMDGYNSTKTKKYPKGQPNAMIARTVESGGTWMAKHPFIGPAVNSTKVVAEMAMAAELDKQIKSKMGG